MKALFPYPPSSSRHPCSGVSRPIVRPRSSGTGVRCHRPHNRLLNGDGSEFGQFWGAHTLSRVSQPVRIDGRPCEWSVTLCGLRLPISCIIPRFQSFRLFAIPQAVPTPRPPAHLRTKILVSSSLRVPARGEEDWRRREFVTVLRILNRLLLR